MSVNPSSFRYTAEHEWIEIRGDVARVGITDFAQAALGDIVYVQMPKVGEAVTADTVCGEVESTKSVSEIYAPVTGTVVAINDSLSNSPETINSDAYGEGWLVKIKPSNLADVDALMDVDTYKQHIGL